MTTKKPAPPPKPKPETKKHAADVSHLAEMLHDDAVKPEPRVVPVLCAACGNVKVGVCAACGN